MKQERKIPFVFQDEQGFYMNPMYITGSKPKPRIVVEPGARTGKSIPWVPFQAVV